MVENNDKYMVHWVEGDHGITERVFSGDKIIERIQEIHDKVFKLYKNMDRFYSDIPVKSNFIQIEYEITDMIEDIQYAQEHYLTIGYIE